MHEPPAPCTQTCGLESRGLRRALLLAGGASTARAESTTNWQLASGTTHLTTTVVASFNFTTQDKSRLLFNGKDGSLLGDRRSKTMTANPTAECGRQGAVGEQWRNRRPPR